MEKVLALGMILIVVFSLGCIQSGDVNNQSVEERHWNKVYAKAFEPVECPGPRDPSKLPDGYYKGPMIDTHIHMQSLPDGEPGMPLEFYSGENIGTKRSVEEWICMMDVEGTGKAFVFFPVWDPIVNESIDFTKKTLERYPGRFIPFIMPPAADDRVNGYPTVDAQELERMLSIQPGLFVGYGEIGLYGRSDGAPPLPPNSTRLQEIYPLVREQNLVVYFHLGQGQEEAWKETLRANPDIIFMWHGDNLYNCGDPSCTNNLADISDILDEFPNVYYGIDELYGDVFILNDRYTKQQFIAHFNDQERLLEFDVNRWKNFTERHQDQILLGTDRGVSATWDKDPEVAIVFNNYLRAFIGRLDPAVQEKLAYKNAEKILGK